MFKNKSLNIIILSFTLLSFVEIKEYTCKATWYDTSKHPKINRKHSTAAVSNDLIKILSIKVGKKDGENIKNGSLLKITNISNNKTDTVEVTDVCKAGPKRVDLSLKSFEKISKKSVGIINVKVKKI